MKNLTSLILITAFYINAFSQTTIPAGNVAGIWTANNSPYLITGDVTITAGSVLNIEPNVIVEFQGFYKIVVEGQLLAVGESDNLITFTVSDTTGFSDTDTTTGAWRGIHFENNDLDTSMLIFCIVKYGKRTSTIYYNTVISSNNYPNLIISNCTIKNCTVKNNIGWQYSIIDIAYFLEFSNNIVVNNTGAAISILSNENSIFNQNLICNNGIAITIIWSNNFKISNSTICNNAGNGIYTWEGCTFSIYNSIIYGNSNYQVESDASSVSAYNCDIENGKDGFRYLYGIQEYINNIDTNPQFVLPTQGSGVSYDALVANWRLGETSPCIDAGIPDTMGLNLNIPEKDLAGNTRIYNDTIDIGAYEYSGDVGVNTLKQSDYFNVYPNPGDETITVLSMLKKTESAKIKIISQSGEELYNENLGKVNHISKEINISNYPAGVYIIQLKTENKEYIKKIIIK